MLVRQDGVALSQTAEKIKGNADEVYKIVEEIYQLLNEKLGMEDDGRKIWFGRNSQTFLNNANNQKPIFEEAKKVIIEQAENLEAQVSSWDSFEA